MSGNGGNNRGSLCNGNTVCSLTPTLANWMYFYTDPYVFLWDPTSEQGTWRSHHPTPPQHVPTNGLLHHVLTNMCLQHVQGYAWLKLVLYSLRIEANPAWPGQRITADAVAANKLQEILE